MILAVILAAGIAESLYVDKVFGELGDRLTALETAIKSPDDDALDEVKELNRLLRICSNNLNQYAKRANETGSIYKADIEDLQRRLDAIWQQQKELLTELAGIE